MLNNLLGGGGGSWSFYLASLLFFSALFCVFYAIAYSIVMRVRDDYHHYTRPPEKGWIRRPPLRRRHRIPLLWILPAGILSAWILVHFMVWSRS